MIVYKCIVCNTNIPDYHNFCTVCGTQIFEKPKGTQLCFDFYRQIPIEILAYVDGVNFLCAQCSNLVYYPEHKYILNYCGICGQRQSWKKWRRHIENFDEYEQHLYW